MNLQHLTHRVTRLMAWCLLAASILSGSLPVTSVIAAERAGNSVVSGNVTNKTTGNGLIGAKVEIPSLGRVALVDQTGRFVLNELPAGTHELVVSYTGLDTQRSSVTLAAGQVAVRDFEMSSNVLMLDTFKVTSEKAGLSSALTQQRN
ncbi:MAG: carboxypeptidase-like regulatory domain-containing protein, partial [Proteobacteria bacterium]|nr:carboxypeptidase-like regulatory domain-containing protein [Pseudomonadota bacterium]